MEQSSFKRDNFSLKLNSNPTKKLAVDFSVRYSNTDINGGGANDTKSTYDSDKRLKYSVIYTPIPLRNLTTDSGNSDDELGNLYDPLVSISDNAREQNRKQLNMAGSVTWEVIDNLKVRAELGLDDYHFTDQRFWGLTTYLIKNEPAVENQGKPAAQFVNTAQKTFRSTNTVNYDFKKLLGENHHLNLMAGHERLLTIADDTEPREVTLQWPIGQTATAIIITPGDITHNITPEELATGTVRITGLTGKTAYTATLKNGKKTRGLVTWTTPIDPLSGATLVTPQDDLAAVLTAASDGDIIALQEGTYNIATINVTKSVIIAGVSAKRKPVLQGTIIKLDNNAGVELKNLILDGTGSTGDQTIVYAAGDNFGALAIDGCEIKNYTKGALYVNYKTKIKSISITNCLYHVTVSSIAILSVYSISVQPKGKKDLKQCIGITRNVKENLS